MNANTCANLKRPFAQTYTHIQTAGTSPPSTCALVQIQHQTKLHAQTHPTTNTPVTVRLQHALCQRISAFPHHPLSLSLRLSHSHYPSHFLSPSAELERNPEHKPPSKPQLRPRRRHKRRRCVVAAAAALISYARRPHIFIHSYGYGIIIAHVHKRELVRSSTQAHTRTRAFVDT